ncbi:AbiH family protein [Hydromonas duriensis]|uniref:Abortive infection AbiH-like protein n=1 Tax=Hydromonas duriensis TaxID=1527608 RepID=A0A4R6Y965_9BURK|nr:AbiH family protein [Hydromonas duriensis]TDR31980.1 abortive infection AbiH-like protein [Hydromonas duriensis]
MERILIIGNGFDLDLGLKTSYQDFLRSESKSFENLIATQNVLARYLNYKNEIQNWVDVEHELKNYANDLYKKPDALQNFLKREKYITENITSGATYYRINDAIFPEIDSVYNLYLLFKTNLKKEFVALKEALCTHLTEAQRQQNDSKSNAYRILKYGTLFNDNGSYHDFNFPDEIEQKKFDSIYSFNYTNSLKDYTGRTDGGHAVEPFFIHGSLNQNNIVFGVEDDSVPEECNFLLKSDHAAFGFAPDLLLNIFSNEPNEFHFFGCSLGDTDNIHFENFFSALTKRWDATNILIPKHHLFFYVYDKSGYQAIRNRILRLTKGQLAAFKKNNKVIFYDIKSNVMIDQNYLNQL